MNAPGNQNKRSRKNLNHTENNAQVVDSAKHQLEMLEIHGAKSNKSYGL